MYAQQTGTYDVASMLPWASNKNPTAKKGSGGAGSGSAYASGSGNHTKAAVAATTSKPTVAGTPRKNLFSLSSLRDEVTD